MNAREPHPIPSSVHTVVLGAGAAGCVIARRLTDTPGRSVLLVEAGPDPDPAHLPADLTDARRNSLRRHDWGWRHRTNRHRRAPFPLPRGKVVGGSSAVNTCIALRGQPGDYDDWASRGLAEWSWERCLPAFREIERDLDPWTDDRWHGRDGPLPIQRDPPERWTRWHAGFVEACRALGFPACDDANVPGSIGVGAHPMNRVDLRRISAAEAWLTPPVRARADLRVLPHTHALRVRTRQGRVTHVDLLRHGQVHRVACERVVLAAGALATPAILLRSGIGPRRELHRHGIDVLRDLPVGERLLDHPGWALFLAPRPGLAHPRDPMIQTALRYCAPGSTIPGTVQVQSGGNWAFATPVVPMVMLMAHLGRPRGHGLLRWPSLRPDARPQVDSRLLDHPDDLRVAVDTMDLMRDLAHTAPLRDLARPMWPRPKALRSRAAREAILPFVTDSGYHPCGTVPMGADDDPDAVCTGRGQVRGVEGLFVGDASLFPSIMTANTHLPTLMVAHRVGGWLAGLSG